jgi:hypothetical protein
MHRILLIGALVCAAVLGGCSEGVLDPKGPVSLAERQILFDSLGIMLAIVIPTILATLTVAYWFRASSVRASYQPEFVYSGRLEVLVWSIPICRMSTPFDMTRSRSMRSGQVVLGLAALALGGCSTGAPSFVLFGAFFPAWLLCGTLGIVGAGVPRAAFVASGLSDALPYQLFVCAAVGVIVALFIWLICFGQ